MADIDLTLMSFCKGEEVGDAKEIVARITEAKVKDKRLIAPKFTEGPRSYYENLGRNLPKEEIMTVLSTVDIDCLFDELSRRFTNLNVMWEDIRSIVMDEAPTYATPDHLEEVRKDFKQAISLKERFREIANK